MTDEVEITPEDERPLTDAELAARITESESSGEPVGTRLRTDGRVLARVTDGIYRQPSSALRELIANAYDADATRVVISTDRPRFARIRVEDDGHGMSPSALANMLHHIGGSAKRSSHGVELGITDAEDATRSPGGRRLIGKIGIGLFSIAQLTQRFNIITKTANDPWRTVASVALRQYTDDVSASSDEDYEAGLVTVWREPATDLKAHGTTIAMDGIRPKTRETLQHLGHWLRVDKELARPPRFHIGHYLPDSGDLSPVSGKLDNVPWGPGDAPADAFKKLIDGVWAQLESGSGNPKIEQLFDYYLQMVWQISLSVPVPYVDEHPFDTRFSFTRPYELVGGGPSRAEPLTLAPDQTVRDALDLGPSLSEGTVGFHVLIDELELRRPLRFDHLPTTTNAVKNPMLFVGHLREEFPGMDREMSGGPLEFAAYLLWAPKIAPIDHVGALVRIHGASGTLFDPTFMRYQVSEITRLRQISCEIFVTQGLEGALNIDRESFNYAHPHVVRLTSWLHAALSRAINTQKQVAATVRRRDREAADDAELMSLSDIVSSAWQIAVGDDDEVPPVVLNGANTEASVGSYVFDRVAVLGDRDEAASRGKRSLERKLQAIVQILAAYNFLEDLDSEERSALVRAIADVLKVGA